MLPRLFCMALLLVCAWPAPTLAADADKVLHAVFVAAETGFDPAITRDLYSGRVNRSIFETLYTYDYLARPAKVVPLTAEALPEISDGGKTYTIRLKQGITFYPDPAFGGKRRELSMADYVYSFQRLFDPRLASPHSWLFAGKVVGFDEAAARAKQSGRFDYDEPIAGFELLDRYTLRIHLKQPDFNLSMILAHEPTSAVAREVIEKYRDGMGQAQSNPVGTGPYHLGEWVRGSRIVLDASPEYRDRKWDFAAGADPEDQAIVAAMQGKRIPQVGRIDVRVMLEDQSRWLAFVGKQVDLVELQGPLAPKALLNGKLRPEFVAQGVQLSRIVDPEISYVYWNMQNPVIGGLSKEKIALRRAIAMAYNVQEEIALVWNGEAIPLEYPIPPGIVGHDPGYRSSVRHDPRLANALLDKFGYKKGADGYRILPDGKPLTITYSARADSNGKLQAEIWKKVYDSLGIRMKDNLMPFPDMLKAERQCELMSRNAPWIADYPDGDNFMQLFYGPNTHQNNNGCSQIPEYDRRYAASQKLPDGPERNRLYREMARILEVYAPIRVGYARYRNMLAQPWVIGFKKHPILQEEWLYIDLAKEKK
ncbi:MAG: ABC transporter substrate-binding protein [Sterolibacterium sp.]|nr:ABC transporter substrate-binding protein [Sterolibacterium sp.]